MAYLAGISAVFVFGMILALLGSIKLRLTPRIGADDAQFGRIVAVLQWTMVPLAVVVGVALDTAGHRVILSWGMLLSAVAMLLVARSRTVAAVMGACVLLGAGGQLVNIGGNTLIPALFKDPSAGSNTGTTFFGLGAFLVPIMTARLFERLDFPRTLTALAAIVAACAAFPLLGAGRLPPVSTGVSLDLTLELLANVVTWAAAATLFCYIGLETSMASWVTTYAARLGADNAQASRMLASFFIAMMISRLTFGLQDRVTGIDLTPIGGWVLAGAGVAAIGAITWLRNARRLAAASAAVTLAGAAFAPIFPTAVGVTFQHFPRAQWGTLFGLVFAIGLVGAGTIPAWIGALLKDGASRRGLDVLRAMALLLTVIALVLGWLPVGDR